MNNIKESLSKRFQEYRVVFWYDEKQEFSDLYSEIEIESVQKIHIENNEFKVKYLINSKEPNQKYLLYFSSEKPVNEANWLLDTEIAHNVFVANQEVNFLQELGLDFSFRDLIKENIKFFKSSERRTKLKSSLTKEDNTFSKVRFKMLAIVFNTVNQDIFNYLMVHSRFFQKSDDHIDKELQRFNLEQYYWKLIKTKFNYTSDKPTIYDLLIELFNKNFVKGGKSLINKESKLFLSEWKNSISDRECFAEISKIIEKDLNIESKLNNAVVDEILKGDLFKLTDLKIIHELINGITAENIPSQKVTKYCKERENKFWNQTFKHFYNCIENASQLIELIRENEEISYNSFEEGIENYANKLSKIDSLYRLYVTSYRKTNQNRILSQLVEKVEKIYTNNWLLNYSENWQKIVDELEHWPNQLKSSQQAFFHKYVKPVISKKQRLFVIISDALRYECGAELSDRLQSEERFTAGINHMFSSLPSYTQLGMASLLPHNELAFKENSDNILVDKMSSMGIAGRSKILEKNSGVRANAIKAEDFMNLNSKKEGRDYVKQYDVIYIYHNRIDKTGDDTTSEDKVFEAVEYEIQYIMSILRRISDMNGNNAIVTSDHGFLYQQKPLNESDFLKSNHKGEVWKENRRFVIGKDLVGDKSTKHFTAKQLNINSNADVLIPKSVNRLRVKASGSRFIHGGASLQEIVIPVISVTKKRVKTVSNVEVDVIKTSDRINSNIVPISFLQQNLVTDKILARNIRASFVADDGNILSDKFEYNFDINEGSERQREVKYQFHLSSDAINNYKNQRVKLMIEVPVKKSNKWKIYKEYYYTLNISFANDFDE